jgi:hemerythrin-like domain-containing protein
MNATDDLRHEHRAVERMLAILERMVARTLSDADAPALAESLEFLRVFVDACHHHKEEELLFPVLLGEDVDGAHEQIDQLLAEHEEGRAIVTVIAAGLGGVGSGDSKAWADIAVAIGEYVALIRLHIASEEAGVFALADVGLSDPMQLELCEGYEDIERNVIGEGKHEAFHEMLDRLDAATPM